MPASAPSTSHKVLTKVDTDGAWRRSYTDHMAYEARRRRKGAWGLKCEMREDGIRTERGEGQLYGQKKDVNAWKIRRNKLWSASLAMAMEEREEASGKTCTFVPYRLRLVVGGKMFLLHSSVFLPCCPPVTCVAFPHALTWRGPTESQVSHSHFGISAGISGTTSPKFILYPTALVE